MANPLNRSLDELLAAGLEKKYREIRARLGISPALKLEPLELECLAYHLGERSGTVRIETEGDAIRVGEPGRPAGLVYRGHARKLLLEAWGISAAEARAGVTIKVTLGSRDQPGKRRGSR